MKKTTISSLIGLLLSTSAYSATTMISADDVVVTASRVPQPIQSVIADVSVITREEIERAGQSTFVELLQTQPGVEISSNGGMGSNASIFLRGTNSNQVLVLIDGLRVNSVTDGRTNFGNIPLAQIERIEILRGSASSLYGQDAIGGVIQIFTKRSDGTPRLNASLGYGTYNTKTAEAGLSGATQDISYSMNISSHDTDGFSAKRIRTGAQRDNDGYRNLSASGSLTYKISLDHEVGIQLFNSEGRVDYDSSNTFKNYADFTQTTIGIFSKNKINDWWKSTIRASESVDENNNFLSQSSVNRVRSKQDQYVWQNDFSITSGTLTFLVDRLEQKLISNTPYDGTERNTTGLFMGYIGQFQSHGLQANIRKENNSQFGNQETGSIGYGYTFNEFWKFNSSIGTAFKAPTFNDLYYPGGFAGKLYGNSELEPETSRNIEASIKYQSQSEAYSITGYKNKIENLILFSGARCSDSSYICNINEAEIKGLTLSGSKAWDTWLLKANYDIQSPKDANTDKLLPLRANRHGSISLSRDVNSWKFTTELVGSSTRYQDTANQFDLAGYAIINFVTTYKINDDWSVQGRVNNLLDKQYALATSAYAIYGLNEPVYNTPGSNLFVSLRYSPSF